MISFSEFLRDFKQKYVCLCVSEVSSKQLREYAQALGFDLSVSFSGEIRDPEDYEFHITIFHTTTFHNTPNQVLSIAPVEVIPDHFELLGENKDIPVLKVRTDNITSFRGLFEQQGYRDKWPSWKPHISLSYNRKQYDLSNLPLPDFKIFVDKLKIEDAI